jgi:hypothetical protein
MLMDLQHGAFFEMYQVRQVATVHCSVLLSIAICDWRVALERSDSFGTIQMFTLNKDIKIAHGPQADVTVDTAQEGSAFEHDNGYPFLIEGGQKVGKFVLKKHVPG